MAYICTISYFDYNHCPESRFMLCLFGFFLQSISRRQQNGSAAEHSLKDHKSLCGFRPFRLILSFSFCLFVILWPVIFCCGPLATSLTWKGEMVWTIRFRKSKKVKAKNMPFITSLGIKFWYLVPGSQSVIIHGTKQGSSWIVLKFFLAICSSYTYKPWGNFYPPFPTTPYYNRVPFLLK